MSDATYARLNNQINVKNSIYSYFVEIDPKEIRTLILSFDFWYLTREKLRLGSLLGQLI